MSSARGRVSDELASGLEIRSRQISLSDELKPSRKLGPNPLRVNSECETQTLFLDPRVTTALIAVAPTPYRESIHRARHKEPPQCLSSPQSGCCRQDVGGIKDCPSDARTTRAKQVDRSQRKRWQTKRGKSFPRTSLCSCDSSRAIGRLRRVHGPMRPYSRLLLPFSMARLCTDVFPFVRIGELRSVCPAIHLPCPRKLFQRHKVNQEEICVSERTVLSLVANRYPASLLR